MTTYDTSIIKRHRRTKAEIDTVCEAMYEALRDYNPMTVRQVFYQMATKGFVPKTEEAYRGTICRLLTQLRLRGIIPFGWIADNTRWMRKPITHTDMEEVLKYNVQAYRRSVWATMPSYVEVWIEKDALAGVLYEVTESWDVPLMVTRGYPSLSYVYEAAQAIGSKGKPAYIYYFGDYDPSGMDISRVLEERLREFAPEADMHFERVAVNPWQISHYNLPTRPTKKTDSRARQFNGDSVELDAMPPEMLKDLVENVIQQHIDRKEYENLIKTERLERESFKEIYAYWKQGKGGN